MFDAAPPPADELRSLYEGREYFVKDGEEGEAETLWGYPDDYLADRPNIELKFDRVVRHLERYVEPGRLLDVGAGPGFLLNVARARGWDPVGLDLNEWAAEFAASELGLEVMVGAIGDDAPFEDETFDAITMMDLVEHVPDPDELLSHAARLLRPGGAIALLTPDAGSVISRALGRRWPEVRRPGEHTVLFSVDGLSATLARHGLVASGWHSIGKTASVATLAADVSPVAPALAARVRSALAGTRGGDRVVEFDPRTKFVLYARKSPAERPVGATRPPRVPRRPERLAHVDAAILDELEALASAKRFSAWMFDQFAEHVSGAAVLEVGAGIGTYTQMMLEHGARELVLLEPEPNCAAELERRFADEPRVSVSRDGLPGAPSLADREGSFELAVCQNVLEHIGDDGGAIAAMAAALRPGGRLVLIVPAGPKLFGPLDDAYGHWRRYALEELRELVADAGLEVESLRHLNALGIAGWWWKNRRPGARIGAASLRAYEAMVTVWRPLEERVGAPVGLSLCCVARKPSTAPGS